MPHRLETTRKSPRQARARSTVQALVTAAAQILEREGLERLSTTAVAERAGFSIGTLYQYFANRDEILLAIAQWELRRVLQGVASEYSAAQPGHRGRSLVRAILRGFGEAPERQATLNLMFRYLGRSELLAEVKRFTTGIASELAGERNLSDAQAFVLSRAVLGVASAALSERHEISSAQLEEELLMLISSYLETAGSAQSNSWPHAG